MYLSAEALAIVVGLVFLVGMYAGRAATITLAKRADERARRNRRVARNSR